MCSQGEKRPFTFYSTQRHVIQIVGKLRPSPRLSLSERIRQYTKGERHPLKRRNANQASFRNEYYF